MKQNHKRPISIRRLTADDPFWTRAAEMQETIALRAAAISREDLPTATRHLDYWLRSESEMLQRVPLDVRATDSQTLVSAKVPGFKECEIELFMDGRCLFITSTATEFTKARQGAPLYSEWRSNQIFRQFDLPVDVEETW
jgi:HSP20 family molecular chaperone IbpA